MEILEKGLEVEVTPIVTDEYITKDNYKQFLKSIKNPFAEIDDDFFTKNTIKRLKSLSNSKKDVPDNIGEILDYLAVVAMINNKNPIKDYERTKNLVSFGMARMQVRLESMGLYKSPFSVININTSILPYCCGVCEYGNFVFHDENSDTIPTLVKYNMIIDAIRLHAQCYRKELTGAYNIINYFIDTPLMEVLETREDLTFIKEFTNPKTGKTLKSFIFNTVI